MAIEMHAGFAAAIATTLILACDRRADTMAGSPPGRPPKSSPARRRTDREPGLAAAAAAALAGIVGCLRTVLYALAYDVVARRLPQAPRLLVAPGSLTAALSVVSRVHLSMPLAGLVACACTAGAWLLIRKPATNS